MSNSTTPPVQPGLKSLLERERELILRRREAAGDKGRKPVPSEDAVGIALSGGGIRSATWCLGLFQGLARTNLVRKLDYLSTVSGGGYFGGFIGRLFTRDWAKNPDHGAPTALQSDCLRGHRPRVAQEFLQELTSAKTSNATRAAESTEVVNNVQATLRNNSSPPLTWLRESGNYLTPSGSGDSALAGAVFVRNWVALLVLILVTLLAVLLGGNLARAGLNSWPLFYRYESWLQTLTQEHWWWTPWFFIPGLIIGLVVVPLGWAYWLTQAGDHRQFTRVAVANLLVIGFGAFALRMLPSSSFHWIGVVLGVEAVLALSWIWFMGAVYCFSSWDSQGKAAQLTLLDRLKVRDPRIVPNRRIVISILVVCLLPAVWRFLLWRQWKTKVDLTMGLWIVSLLLVAAGLHHLALRVAQEGHPSSGLKAWLGSWDFSRWKNQWPEMAVWLGLFCVIPLVLTVWPGWWQRRPRVYELLTIWAFMAFMMSPYLLAYQVFQKEARLRREDRNVERPLLTHWLRSKLSRTLTTGLIAYAAVQSLVIINAWGQSIYAMVTYSGGTKSAAAVITGLLGLASLAPLVRAIGVRTLGGDSKFRLPLKAVALVGALVLAMLLALSISYVSHGIAWRWGCPVLVQEAGTMGLRERLESEWNLDAVSTAAMESSRAALQEALPESPGANLYRRLVDRREVVLNSDNVIEVRESEPVLKPYTLQSRMFLLDLGFSFAVASALTLLLGRTRSFLNLSSFHSFYTSRLVRAYLGASNERRWRRSNISIAEVDRDDDIPWRNYCPHEHGGPLHLVNVALNSTVSLETSMESTAAKGFNLSVGPAGLSFGRRHASWSQPPAKTDAMSHQEKRTLKKVIAESEEGGPSDWVHLDELQMTQSTGMPRNETIQPKLLRTKYVESLTLGSWVGISGAAFTTGLGNVGAGGGTSLGTSLLCGLFNVRLGYWWKNNFSPCGSLSWDHNFPVQYHLANELTGAFSIENRKRWYLSDGGHFENTAAYELIRRRAPFIVISDCGADPEGELDDVANLVRRARMDFGAEITFLRDEELVANVHHDLLAPCVIARARSTGPADLPEPPVVAGKIGTPDDLRPRANPGALRRVRAHAALAWVKYPHEAGMNDASTLLLIKPGITDDLPADLLNYQLKHPKFPHQSTLDQFFDEAQWESYRKLGELVASSMFAERTGDRWTPHRMARLNVGSRT